MPNLAGYSFTNLRKATGSDLVEVVKGAEMELRELVGGLPLAQVYSDRAGTTPLGNPWTLGASEYSGVFYAERGHYQLEATKDAQTFTVEFLAVGFDEDDEAEIAALADSAMGSMFPQVTQAAITANAELTNDIPLGCEIQSIYVKNTTANTVTGGIKIGTTAGGTDIVEEFSVPGSFEGMIPLSLIDKRFFSEISSQGVFVHAITAWNSASLNIRIQCRRVF